MSYPYLELEVVRWAEARGIVQNSNPLAQAEKTLEECGELLIAAATGDMNAYKDALADVLITLIIGAACADVDLVACLNDGYETIKHRTGKLGKNGVFIKD